jgi:hypothetical protein
MAVRVARPLVLVYLHGSANRDTLATAAHQSDYMACTQNLYSHGGGIIWDNSLRWGSSWFAP